MNNKKSEAKARAHIYRNLNPKIQENTVFVETLPLFRPFFAPNLHFLSSDLSCASICKTDFETKN